MANNLTKLQAQWLDLFFGEAKGDARLATELSDYAEGTAPAVVVGALQEEIAERTKKLMTASGTKAYYKMIEILDSPTTLGAKELITAAKDIMDRAGMTKTDKLEVKSVNPVFILPAKDSSIDEEE